MSFKSRIFLSFSLLFLIALLLPFLHFKEVLHETVTKEARSRVKKNLQHIQWLLHDDKGLKDPRDLQAYLMSLSKNLNIRISYIANNGVVIADSGVIWENISKMDLHSERPEIQKARTQNVGISIRYSNTLQTSFIYAATRVQNSGELPSGYLRVAMPYSQVQAILDRATGQHTIVVVFSLIVLGALSWIVARQLSKQVYKISQVAESISEGNFAKRIDFSSDREFLPIIKSINKIAKNMQSHLYTISEQKDELEAILNGMRDGVLLLDSRCKVKAYNRAIEEIFNVTGTLKGREPIEFVRSPELQSTCKKLIFENEPIPHSFSIKLAGERFFDVTIIPMVIKKRREIEIILVFHDITDFKRLENIRKDFIANVSHELRTPLTSIKGYTETLREPELLDLNTIRSFTQVIQKNVDQMTHLLNDLLQLARLESMESQEKLVPVNVNNALQEAREICQPFLEEKKITIENKLSQEVVVISDYEQLVRVLVNLIENAIKYSPYEDKIIIDGQEEDSNWLISIQDNGPGIPLEDRVRIFERFYRVEKNRNKMYSVRGSGLGLSICKHILENQGGRIWVESPASESLQGSIFRFTLPKAKASSDLPCQEINK